MYLGKGGGVKFHARIRLPQATEEAKHSRLMIRRRWRESARFGGPWNQCRVHVTLTGVLNASMVIPAAVPDVRVSGRPPATSCGLATRGGLFLHSPLQVRESNSRCTCLFGGLRLRATSHLQAGMLHCPEPSVAVPGRTGQADPSQ